MLKRCVAVERLSNSARRGLKIRVVNQSRVHTGRYELCLSGSGSHRLRAGWFSSAPAAAEDSEGCSKSDVEDNKLYFGAGYRPNVVANTVCLALDVARE